MQFIGKWICLPVIAVGLSLVPPVSTLAQGTAPDSRLSGKRCKMKALERSKCIIEAILDDVARTYDQPGGGGISAIKQNSTTSFTVSIAQEERVDLLTYEAKFGPDGKVTVSHVKTDTASKGH